MPSVEYVENMNTEDLCTFLLGHPELRSVDDHRKIKNFLNRNEIRGVNFMRYTKEDWKAEGIPGGIADSFAFISSEIRKKSKEKADSIKKWNFIRQKIKKIEQKKQVMPERTPFVLNPIDVKLNSLETVNAEGVFVDISGLFHAGLAVKSSDTKRLFIRSATLLLLNRLRKEDYQALRVFGSPGIGKSFLVWAWACDEYLRKKKKVLWIHLSKAKKPKIILMDGNGIFKVKHSDENFVSSSDADIIIVDGVVGDSPSHNLYVENSLEWDPYPNRKSIQVVSMQVRIDEDDDEVDNISCFTMAPWTLEDYNLACSDSLFFESVKWAFDGVHAESKEDLISQKFYFAGCSARWMFNCSLSKLKLRIERHIQSCPNAIALLQGIVGQSSPFSVNHLVVAHPLNEELSKNFFVSKYVARRVLSIGGSEAVKYAYGIACGLNNPSFTGWIVEMDFIQQLYHNIGAKVSIHYFSLDLEPLDDKWDVPGVVDLDFSYIGSVREKVLSGIIDFDVKTIQFRKESIFLGFWLVPTKWNQGGFDVARLLKFREQYMLSFVQITASHEHSLKLKYFQDLTSAIAFALGIEISRIQIIMLVPNKTIASNFSISLSKVSNPGFLKFWKCGESEEYWTQGAEHNQVDVMWFDSLL